MRCCVRSRTIWPFWPQTKPSSKDGLSTWLYNRGFERKSYRNEHGKDHDSNLTPMELCNEPDSGKRFSNKELTQKVCGSVNLISQEERVRKGVVWLLVRELLHPTEYEARTFLG